MVHCAHHLGMDGRAAGHNPLDAHEAVEQVAEQPARRDLIRSERALDADKELGSSLPKDRWIVPRAVLLERLLEGRQVTRRVLE